jgi:hypothetical protein
MTMTMTMYVTVAMTMTMTMTVNVAMTMTVTMTVLQEVKAELSLHPPHLPWSHSGLFDSLDHASIRSVSLSLFRKNFPVLKLCPRYQEFFYQI